MKSNVTACRSFTLTLILSGFEELSREIQDAFYEAGCDDGLLGVRNRVPYLDFDRVSDALPQAILSAVADVQSTGLAKVIRIEPGDTVNASEIARRTNRTRQSIQQLMSGTRGPGGFPSPVAGLRASSPMWSWAGVAAWMRADLRDDNITRETVENARFIALLNYTLGWPVWGGPDLAKRLYRCVQPGHEHSDACRDRDWLSDLQGA